MNSRLPKWNFGLSAGARLFSAACLAVALGTSTAVADEPSFPARTIKLISPYAPGGGNDLMARTIGAKVATLLGQPVVIENREGAGGTIGTAVVASAKADGYTLLLAASANAIAASINTNLPYDLITSFQPVAGIGLSSYVVVVNNSLPVKSIRDLVDLAKQKTGQLNYASAGVGTQGHLAGALFNKLATIDIVHVPFPGAAPALQSVVAGYTQMVFDATDGALARQFVDTGQVRVLAVTTPKRSPRWPDVPTMQEAGVPGYEVGSWYGIMAPAGTPDAVIRLLSDSIAKALSDTGVGDAFKRLGVTPGYSSAQEFGSMVKADLERIGSVVKSAGLRPD